MRTIAKIETSHGILETWTTRGQFYLSQGESSIILSPRNLSALADALKDYLDNEDLPCEEGEYSPGR